MPDAGTIGLGGEDITRLPPADRPIGYVPQSFALYPHLTVYREHCLSAAASRSAR